MKTRFVYILIAVFAFSAFAKAQRGLRVGYIDMEYILENVPEYQTGVSQLDTKVVGWRNDMQKLQSETDGLISSLENERVLLTRELIQEREEEIKLKQQELFDYQQKRFGPGGDYILQKERLIQPIQDQVFNAVQDIATKRKYDFVFDKAGEMTMLFSADRHDISDQVLRAIGRTSKRKQLDNKQDRKQFDEEEALTVEQDDAQSERQRILDEKKSEREKAREAKRAEYEAKRNKLLEERKRRKDSIATERARLREEAAARRNGKTVPASTPPAEGEESSTAGAGKSNAPASGSDADEKRKARAAKLAEIEAAREEKRQAKRKAQEERRAAIRAAREGNKGASEKTEESEENGEESVEAVEKTEEAKEETPADKKQAARAAKLAEMKAKREAEREAKRKEYEARRAKLLEARKRRKDSIAAARNGGGTKTPPGGN